MARKAVRERGRSGNGSECDSGGGGKGEGEGAKTQADAGAYTDTALQSDFCTSGCYCEQETCD